LVFIFDIPFNMRYAYILILFIGSCQPAEYNFVKYDKPAGIKIEHRAKLSLYFYEKMLQKP